MLDKIRAMTGLGRAGAFNPGARLVAPKQGTGKRLSPKEREKLRKEREKEERKQPPRGARTGRERRPAPGRRDGSARSIASPGSVRPSIGRSTGDAEVGSRPHRDARPP